MPVSSVARIFHWVSDGLVAFTEVRCHNVMNHDDFKQPTEPNPAIGWDKSRKQASAYDLSESKP